MKALILTDHAENYVTVLEPKFPDVSFHTADSQEAAAGVIEDVEILFVLGKYLSDDFIGKASKLKWLQALTTGVDNIVCYPSLKKDVLLTSARGIHGPRMSEFVFLLMLSLNRNFPQIIRNQDQKIWERIPAKLLHDKTVGILGIGVIAEELGPKCKAFGMTVYGITSTKRSVNGFDRLFTREELPQVAKDLDYLVVLVPHTAETEKLVSAEVIAAMKPTAFLINVARGKVIDEEALIKALKGGKIAGAGLDVFWEEPLPGHNPLWEMKNVIVTPRCGGATDVNLQQITPLLEQNLRHFLNNEMDKMLNILDH